MKEIKIEGKVDKKVITDYLQNLSKSINSGKVLIHRGSDELVLEPGEKIEIKVEAKQKTHKEKLDVRISWDKSRKPADNPRISE